QGLPHLGLKGGCPDVEGEGPPRIAIAAFNGVERKAGGFRQLGVRSDALGGGKLPEQVTNQSLIIGAKAYRANPAVSSPHQHPSQPAGDDRPLNPLAGTPLSIASRGHPHLPSNTLVDAAAGTESCLIGGRADGGAAAQLVAEPAFAKGRGVPPRSH